MRRRIPATMATQHPDNASAPYWKKDRNAFVSTRDETEECYSAFRDLDCQEFMWDWEGKYVDEAIIDRLFSTYLSFFKTHQLGKDKFLTFRIPNIWHERGYSLARAMMGILTAESFARDLQIHAPPLFEVILPMTNSAEDLLHIQTTFEKLAKFEQGLFGDTAHSGYLNVLPLFEGIDDLINSRKLLRRYVVLHNRHFRKKPDYLRLHIARSDPALNSGLVAAVIAGKIALSEFSRFSSEEHIPVYPAIGVGTLPFRGSLSPERIENFMREYPGMRTVYVQSAFRYDFPLPLVKKAIRILNERLQRTRPLRYRDSEVEEAAALCALFSAPYRKTVEGLAHLLNRLSSQVPARRERKLHTGLFGYSRSIGKKRLPRAIPFTAVLYTLGVPPEFIGTGRGLAAAARASIDTEKYYTNLRPDLECAGKYLNKENLHQLARANRFWKAIEKDVLLAEAYLGIEFGPKTRSELAHAKISAKAYHRFRKGKTIGEAIAASGRLRKSLG
ncbi:MAG: phosphoenolpyruvate carboxylase [Patescibacteria group bacterium]|nr:phosphoenolpyruvate carboxylase [Patescibacteria group bacterium]